MFNNVAKDKLQYLDTWNHHIQQINLIGFDLSKEEQAEVMQLTDRLKELTYKAACNNFPITTK